jgi:arylsulfatase B/arylsulfatase I/J
LGWNDVGFRSHQIKTPTIDALAGDGRILEQYYVQDVCSPSRAAFQTGRYPIHNTVNDWLRGDGNLPVNETLIPQKLKAAGYVSHAVGKVRRFGDVFPKECVGSVFSVLPIGIKGVCYLDVL